MNCMHDILTFASYLRRGYISIDAFSRLVLERYIRRIAPRQCRVTTPLYGLVYITCSNAESLIHTAEAAASALEYFFDATVIKYYANSAIVRGLTLRSMCSVVC